MQNICDGGYNKHGSDFSCVCDAGHTVQFNELFVMRQNNRNGQPDEGVCDIRHTVRSNELFGLGKRTLTVQPSLKVNLRTSTQRLIFVFKKQKLSKSNEIDLLQANQHVFKKQKMSKITKQRPRY